MVRPERAERVDGHRFTWPTSTFDKMRGRGETVMKKLIPHMTALAIALAAGSYVVFAQQRGGGGPPPPMSFFITSVPKGDGANYGGLAGADAYCQQLATAAGRGSPVTWHAYLSTQGAGAVSARDRIGN